MIFNDIIYSIFKPIKALIPQGGFQSINQSKLMLKQLFFNQHPPKNLSFILLRKTIMHLLPASKTMHYTCSPDNEDADINNVAAYLEVDFVEEQLPMLVVNNDNISLSSDLDSVNPDITPFSPVTPKSPSNSFQSMIMKLTKISSLLYQKCLGETGSATLG